MCHSSDQYQHHDRHFENKVTKEGLENHQQEIMTSKVNTMDTSATQFSSKMHHANLNNNSYINVRYHSESDAQSIMKSGELSNTDSLTFFNETLELSQEDIQKTLSANMPLNTPRNRNGNNVSRSMNNSTIRSNIHGTDSSVTGRVSLNPLDFIDNCCNDTNVDVGVPSSVHDDDVFVNLDAFDMFVEFPELDLDAKSSLNSSNGNNIDMVSEDVSNSLQISQNLEHESNTKLLNDVDNSTLSPTIDTQQNCTSLQFHSQLIDNETHSDLFNITDYSPEWAYTEGGIKVLVTGPWNQSSNYTVLFDSFPVPTTIVQTGVLRCYCPAHEVGLVTLQVACDGYVISNSCIFEYKSLISTENDAACDGAMNISKNNETIYKFNLFNRIESIEQCMQIKMEPSESVRLQL